MLPLADTNNFFDFNSIVGLHTFSFLASFLRIFIWCSNRISEAKTGHLETTVLLQKVTWMGNHTNAVDTKQLITSSKNKIEKVDQEKTKALSAHKITTMSNKKT